MAETDTVETVETPTAETVVETPPVETVSAPVVTPSADEEVQRLREENARLSGRLEQAERQPKPEAKPAKSFADYYTEINAAREAGTINDLQFAAAVADVRYEERRAAERAREERDAPEAAAAEDLAAYVAKYPDLADPASELLGKVKAELARRRERYRHDPNSKQVQLAAVEAVVGGHRLGGGTVDQRELDRRRRPGSGGGTATVEDTPARQKSKGQDLWNRMTPAAQADFLYVRKSPAAAIKSLEHATDESIALMRKAGRFK